MHIAYTQRHTHVQLSGAIGANTYGNDRQRVEFQRTNRSTYRSPVLETMAPGDLIHMGRIPQPHQEGIGEDVIAAGGDEIPHVGADEQQDEESTARDRRPRRPGLAGS